MNRVGLAPRLLSATLLLGTLWTGPALAANDAVAHAEPGGGQAALAVGVDAQGELRARVCAKSPCSVAGGQSLELPSDYRARLKRSTLRVVPLGGGRRAIVVEVPGPSADRAWHAVVVAPLGGKSEPKFLFRGETGYISGEWGERSGPMVQVSERRQDGSRAILVGQQREDLTLCSRPTILAPQLLFPKDLTLKPARVQRLTPEERDNATRVTAVRITEEDSTTPLPLLRARGASSAIGNPAALTDGDLDTFWSENRGGDGKGEFLMMRAPRDLPITGFELVVRPKSAEVPSGVAPKELFLVTDDALHHVSFLEDAWQHPGARYRVELPSKVQTDCVAVVLDTAHGDQKTAQVTLTELSARTEVDASSLDALVGSLAGGGQRAQAAATALSLLGGEAFAAVAASFNRLDENGRLAALSVMDHAPCPERVITYVDALLGPFKAQRSHARERLRRCAKEGSQALVARLQKEPTRMRQLAVELAAIDATAAVVALSPRMGQGKREERLAMRIAVGRASRDPSAKVAITAALRDPKLPAAATLDLLRALGDEVARFAPASADALARISGPKDTFRQRYLRLEPAALLAAKDDRARALLATAITQDRSHHVRARAAELVRSPKTLQQELLAALKDPEVRVRESAVTALASPTGAFARAPLLERLRDDRWPLVRASTAIALGRHPADPSVDAALGAALTDSSAFVRGPIVSALGQRKAISQAPGVRKRFVDEEEATDVRARAAEALGQMCDHGAVDVLTQAALRLSDPMLPAEPRGVSLAALAALARLSPPDLARRIEGLTSKEAPPSSRHAAEAALQAKAGCAKPTR